MFIHCFTIYYITDRIKKKHSNLIKVDLISVISKQSDYAVRTVDLAMCYYLSVWWQSWDLVFSRLSSISLNVSVVVFHQFKQSNKLHFVKFEITWLDMLRLCFLNINKKQAQRRCTFWTWWKWLNRQLLSFRFQTTLTVKYTPRGQRFSVQQ